MGRYLRGACSGEKGQDLIEFAISVMLLLALASGIVDFGGAFQHYIVVTNSSREGARQAARAPCDVSSSAQRAAYRASVVSAALNEAAVGNVTITAANVAIVPDPVSQGCAVAGNPVVVTVSHNYTLQLATLGITSLNLRGRTEMAYSGRK